MKAMLWKELRENLKWAVLAMFVLGLAEFYGLTQASNYDYDSSATLCRPAFLMSTTFGCATVGFILGLIQILPEKRRDQWAALLHRPVPRATIFQGKACAGLLLYLLATLLPFLACVWYVATPGNFPLPFVRGMMRPGIADILAGMMYYFAALFVGLRNGAWYGTRAFGLPAAVIGTLLVVATPYFTMALGGAVFLTLALFLAGRGTILTNGRLRDQSALGRSAIVTVVLFGVCALVVFVMGSASMFLGGAGYRLGGHYEIDVDGRPLKISSNVNESSTTVTDLAGNVVQDKRFVSGSRYNYMLQFTEVTSSIGEPRFADAEPDGIIAEYRGSSTYVGSAAGDYDNGAERWYYLPGERCFVGYHIKTNQRIGAIGQDGFRPGFEPVAPLAKPGFDPAEQVEAFVRFGETVYHSDFDQRKLPPIFSQPGTKLFGVAPLRSSQDQTLALDWAAVALRDKMLVLDRTGAVRATLPYHQDTDRWGRLELAVKPGRERFFLYYLPTLGGDYQELERMPSYLEEMDAKGTLLNTYTLPAIPTVTAPESWPTLAFENVAGGLVPPAFVAVVLASEKIHALYEPGIKGRPVSSKSDGQNLIHEIGIRMTIGSLIFAGLTLLWCRRMHFSWRRAWSWTAFVLAFNFIGLITFRLVADWPVRLPCPQCNRNRPVEDDLCPHCGAEWPKPVGHGTEIFDQPEEAAIPAGVS